MKNIDACMSSQFMDWGTPQEFFDKLNKEFNFDLDFCANYQNWKCDDFYTPDIDALKQFPKGRRIFCNPPYGKDIKRFVKKCYELSKDNFVVMLVPARTDTVYWHEYIFPHADVRFIKGRLKFEGEQKGSGSAPFPSAIVIFKQKGSNGK